MDIVTLGMNMYSQGVDPKIDFSDMPHICEVYEKCTGMKVTREARTAERWCLPLFPALIRTRSQRACTGEEKGSGALERTLSADRPDRCGKKLRCSGIVTPGDFQIYGRTITTEAKGNGRLNAVSNALKKAYELKFDLVTYQEHALNKAPAPRAIAYGNP